LKKLEKKERNVKNLKKDRKENEEIFKRVAANQLDLINELKDTVEENKVSTSKERAVLSKKRENAVSDRKIFYFIVGCVCHLHSIFTLLYCFRKISNQ
jgi:hypothetical protein